LKFVELLRRRIAPTGGRARKREFERERDEITFFEFFFSSSTTLNSPSDAALNPRSFSLSSTSKQQQSIFMTQPSQNTNDSKREAGSEGDDSPPPPPPSSSSSSSSSPRPPPSPWAEETSATSSLPSQPPPHRPTQPQCNPKRLACEIQACFKRRGFEDPSRCAAEFEALKRCCETLTEESLHCSSDWRKK